MKKDCEMTQMRSPTLKRTVRLLTIFSFACSVLLYFSSPSWAIAVSVSIQTTEAEYDIGANVELTSTPGSQIANNSGSGVTGALKLSVQKQENAGWIEKVVVYQNANVSVPPNSALPLHVYWNNSPWVSERPGNYRAVAEFTAPSSYVTDTSEFTVRVMDLSMADQTIVVYNTNSTDSYEIAAYYAEARGIPETHLCPVMLPTGQFANKDEFLGARKLVIENCICTILQNAHQAPIPCDTSNLNAIAAVSPITHMVLIRGIPPRLYGTGWPDDNQEPSLDYYLSATLYGNNNLFDAGQQGYLPMSPYGRNLDNPQNPIAQSRYIYALPIQPAVDRIVAYGRVEAITKEKTLDLIDRTLEAERHGLQGNFIDGLINSTQGNETSGALRNATASQNSVCFNYITEPAGTWPYQQCLTGLTRGELPGESGSSVPLAYNVGLYLGQNEINNGHSAFDGFNNMLNWRKTDAACSPLCRQLAGSEIINCMDHSTDYFKEINTDCVGAAPGLIGYQLRSWPVQYYGFWPQGWTHINGGDGAIEKTPPTILTGNAFINQKFTDDRYLHFGALDASANPMCVHENGDASPCPEKIAVNLEQLSYLDPKITVQPNHTFTVRFRHRHPATAGANWSVINVYFRFDGDGTNYVKLSEWVDLSALASSWQTNTLTFPVAETGRIINRVILDFRTPVTSAPANSLDLDAFEVVDNLTGREILDVEASSFAEPYNNQTTPGDYAANAIDRLGGIGWWGSSSHFGYTGGHSFQNTVGFAGAFLAGRTLGESLMYSGNADGMAGIIYGDPVYRPAAAKMYLASGSDIFNDPNRPFVFREADDSRYKGIFISALQGHDYYLTTNWEISVCEEGDILGCDSRQAWQPFTSGTGAGLDQEAVPDLMSLISDPFTNLNLIVRLKVWNTNGANNALYNYGYLAYKSGYDSAYQYAISSGAGRGPKISGNRAVWITDGGSCQQCTQIHMYNFNSLEETVLVEDSNIVTVAIDGDDVVWGNDRIGQTPRNQLKHMSILSGVADLNLPLRMQAYTLDISNRKIVYADTTPSNLNGWEIFLYDLNASTGQLRQLTAASGDQRNPSIDGNLIVWEDYTNGTPSIILYDLNGGSPQPVTTGSSSGLSNPHVRNGHVVWQEHRNGNFDVALCKTERNGLSGGCFSTDEKIYLTSDAVNQFSPKLSNGVAVWEDFIDGQNLDISASRYSIVDASPRRLTNEPGYQQDPDIDGNRIVYLNVNDDGRIYVYLLDEQSDQPPRAPENLRTTSVAFNSVGIAWDDRSINEDGFYLVRTLSPVLPSYPVYPTWWDLPAGTTSFTDDTVSPESQYTYRVFAVNSVGTSDPSNELTLVTPLDNPPAAVIVSPQNGVIVYDQSPYFTVNVSDDVGLSRGEIWLDGSLVMQMTFEGNTTSVNYRHPTPFVYETFHQYEIRVWDVGLKPLAQQVYTQFFVHRRTTRGSAGPPRQTHMLPPDQGLPV